MREQVYIAGKFEARARLRGIREALLRLGYEVTSSWLREGDHLEENAAFLADPVRCLEVAHRDVDEVMRSDLFLLDTYDENNRGGREVEFGAAYNSPESMDIWVIGPIRNVFHHLADQHYPNWSVALTALAKRARAHDAARELVNEMPDELDDGQDT